MAAQPVAGWTPRASTRPPLPQPWAPREQPPSTQAQAKSVRQLSQRGRAFAGQALSIERDSTTSQGMTAEVASEVHSARRRVTRRHSSGWEIGGGWDSAVVLQSEDLAVTLGYDVWESYLHEANERAENGFTKLSFYEKEALAKAEALRRLEWREARAKASEELQRQTAEQNGALATLAKCEEEKSTLAGRLVNTQYTTVVRLVSEEAAEREARARKRKGKKAPKAGGQDGDEREGVGRAAIGRAGSSRGRGG